MLPSLALVFLAGLALGALAQRLGLPRLVGMLGTGILLGPWCLNLLDGSLLAVSAQLRQAALVVILIKAGLSLRLEDLKKVGRPALLLSFLPAGCEILAVILLAPPILGLAPAEAAVLGAVLGAVSPAVVVPRMVALMEEGRGTEKGIPQMILAGASLDDVFVIVLFTTFLGMAKGEGAEALALAEVPASIASGLLAGAAVGCLLARFFRSFPMEGTLRSLTVLSVAFLLVGAEELWKGRFPFSGLLAVMSMALLLARRGGEAPAEELRGKFGRLWLGAEVLLFTLVGAAVDIRYTLQAGPLVLLVILGALAVRSVGVWIAVQGTALNRKERLYCVIAYLPKATVQAAIGGVPLTQGLPCGALILSAAVLAILLTAPLGAWGMDRTCGKLLKGREKREIP